MGNILHMNKSPLIFENAEGAESEIELLNSRWDDVVTEQGF